MLLRRWRLWLSPLLLGLVVWLAAGVFFHANCRGCISLANYHRIKPGVTRAEVVDLMGSEGEMVSMGMGRIWSDEDMTIIVLFDRDGNVQKSVLFQSDSASFWTRYAIWLYRRL